MLSETDKEKGKKQLVKKERKKLPQKERSKQ